MKQVPAWLTKNQIKLDLKEAESMKVGFLTTVAVVSMSIMGAEATTMGLQVMVSGGAFVVFALAMREIIITIREKEAGWKK